MVKNQQKKFKKVIFDTKIPNTFDFWSQKPKKKSVMFFSDFSHGITHLYTPPLKVEARPKSETMKTKKANFHLLAC